MGLIINQGKQDVSKDNNFEIMISEKETAQIVKIEVSDKFADSLKITLKVIGNSKYANRLIFDNISYTGDYSWKYRNIRKAAGVPYVESEPVNIDIEKLLLNKAVAVKLGIRKGSDGNEYQSVTYLTQNKPANTVAPSAPSAPTTTSDANPFEDFDELVTSDDSSNDDDNQITW